MRNIYSSSTIFHLVKTQMRTSSANSPRFFVLAQIFLLLCNTTCVPSLASTKHDLDYADLNKLANLETIIYGSTHKNIPSEKRVDSLEKIIFGKTHSGPLHTRIFAIANALNGTNNNNNLLPPLAPSLDSENTAKGPAPSIAQQDDWEPDQDQNNGSDAKQARITKTLQQAMQLYNQGQTGQAESMFKNVLALDSTNSDANFNLGAIAEERSDWQSALNYYQAALQSNPNDRDTQNAVASMQAKLAASKNNHSVNADGGIKLSNKQIAALKAKVNQAADDYGKGNYDAAISNLKSVLNKAPNQADVYFALGQAYKAKGETSQAADAFSQALRLAPGNSQYAAALAQINNTGSDTFSSGNTNQSNDSAKQNQLAYNNNDSSKPAGEITPFSDQGNNQLGWQPAGGSSYGGTSYSGSYYSTGSGSRYMPGYTYSNYIPYNMTSMIGGAAIGGLMGAAVGSMFAGSGYRMRGAMIGGMAGSMMGLMSGRYRRW